MWRVVFAALLLSASLGGGFALGVALHPVLWPEEEPDPCPTCRRIDTGEPLDLQHFPPPVRPTK